MTIPAHWPPWEDAALAPAGEEGRAEAALAEAAPAEAAPAQDAPAAAPFHSTVLADDRNLNAGRRSEVREQRARRREPAEELAEEPALAREDEAGADAPLAHQHTPGQGWWAGHQGWGSQGWWADHQGWGRGGSR